MQSQDISLNIIKINQQITKMCDKFTELCNKFGIQHTELDISQKINDNNCSTLEGAVEESMSTIFRMASVKYTSSKTMEFEI